MDKKHAYKLILTSFGLTGGVGRGLIAEELRKDGDLKEKRIFLFHEPYYSIGPILTEACTQMGFALENIVLSGRQHSKAEIENVDYVYVTEGNTFEVLSLIREQSLVDAMRKAVFSGATYIGASAGAMIAGVSIKEAISFDRNFVRMDDFTGLRLFDGIVIPHYEKSELKRYIENSPGIECEYKNIYSVKNDGILVMEM